MSQRRCQCGRLTGTLHCTTSISWRHWRSLWIASGFTAFETPENAGGVHHKGHEEHEGSLNQSANITFQPLEVAIDMEFGFHLRALRVLRGKKQVRQTSPESPPRPPTSRENAPNGLRRALKDHAPRDAAHSPMRPASVTAHLQMRCCCTRPAQESAFSNAQIPPFFTLCDGPKRINCTQA